jgi:hypothetical protein
MAILETLKKVAEKATGLSRPASDQIEGLLRIRKLNTLKFEDDGIIPNNSRWPFVFYRAAVALPDDLDPAAVMEELFRQNGWGATGYTTTFTIILVSMRYLALHGAKARYDSAATRAELCS